MLSNVYNLLVFIYNLLSYIFSVLSNTLSSVVNLVRTIVSDLAQVTAITTLVQSAIPTPVALILFSTLALGAALFIVRLVLGGGSNG